MSQVELQEAQTRIFDVPEQSIKLTAKFTLDNDLHVVETLEEHPADLEGYDIVHEVRRAYGTDLGEAVEFWAYQVTPYHEVEFMADNLSDYPGLIRLLGVSYEETEITKKGQLRRRSISKYPSVNRLNQVLNEVLEGGGVRFEEYDGGEYSAKLFAERLIDDGVVLIGREQPYNIHDICDHALGWVAMGDGLFDDLRNRLEAQRQRMIEQEGQPEIERQFPKSELVLIEAVANLDYATGNIWKAVVDEDESNRPITAADTFGNIFTFSLSRQKRGVPKYALGEPPDCRHAAAIAKNRFRELNEAGLRLAA